MSWFKWYHGTCESQEIAMVAVIADVHHCAAISGWAWLLEHACMNDPVYGSVARATPEYMAVELRMPLKDAEALFAAFAEEGFITEDRRIANWKKYARPLPNPNRPGTKEWLLLRAAVFQRDGEVCAYCSTSNGPFDVDHVTPLFRGGTNELSNLAVSCSSCNRSKGKKTVDEWLAEVV